LSSQGLQTSWKSGTAYLTCVSESRLQARWLSVRDVQPRDRCISPERQVTGSGRAWTLRPLHPHQGFLVCILCLHFEEMPPSSFSQPHEPPLTLDLFSNHHANGFTSSFPPPPIVACPHNLTVLR
jgi:hypothetical protein